jgi:hypothetical protein
MKAHQLESHKNPPRRRLLGAVAGALAGLVAWKLSRRKLAVSPSAEHAESSPTTATTTASKLVVKPAPNSVKRHG